MQNIHKIRLIWGMLISIAGGNYFSLHAQILHPAKDNLACTWGLKNDSNEWVIKPQFDDIQPFLLHRAVVRIGEKKGLITDRGKMLMAVEYDEVSPYYSYPYSYQNYYGSEYSSFQNYSSRPDRCRFIIARQEKKKFLLDSNGVRIDQLSYDDIYAADDYFITTNNKLKGLRKLKEEIFAPEYTMLDYAGYNNFFIVSRVEDKPIYAYPEYHDRREIGLINDSGRVLIPLENEQILMPDKNSIPSYAWGNSGYYGHYPNIILVRKNKLWGFYSYKGEMIHPCEFELPEDVKTLQESYYYKGQQIAVKKQNKSGVLIIGKKFLIPPEYDQVILQAQSNTKPNQFWNTTKGNVRSAYDTSGRMLFSGQARDIRHFGDSVLLVEQTGKQMLIPVYGKKFPVTNFDTILSSPSPGICISGSRFYIFSNGNLLRAEQVKNLTPAIYRVRFREKNFYYEYYFRKDGRRWEKAYYESVSFDDTHYLLLLYDGTNAFYVDSSGNPVEWTKKYRSLTRCGLISKSAVIVTTKSGKQGIAGIDGKLIIDTLFEAFGNYPANAFIWVKPWQPYDSTIFGRCMGGWALADSNGHLLTAPRFMAPAYFSQIKNPLLTNKGYGVFNPQTFQQLTPDYFDSYWSNYEDDPEHSNWFMLRTRSGNYAATDTNGNLLTDTSWTNAISISSSQSYYFSYSIMADQLFAIGKPGWLLLKKDSAAFVNSDGIIRRREDVRNELFYHARQVHITGNQWDVNTGRSSGPQLVMPDSLPGAVYDSLFNRIIRACDTLTNDREYFTNQSSETCDCAGKPFESNYRYEPYYDKEINRLTASFRLSYCDESLLSLQTMANYYNYMFLIKSDYEPVLQYFENYFADEKGWHKLKPEDMFKPGYQKKLRDELARSIQLNDQLVLDCTDPGRYLAQENLPVGFSREGLVFYLHAKGYEEYFAPIVVKWKDIKSIIPKKSPLHKFLSKPSGK